MLKDRLELLELEIVKLKKICGEMYIAKIRGTPTHASEVYDLHVERLATMKTESDIIRGMINDGHA